MVTEASRRTRGRRGVVAAGNLEQLAVRQGVPVVVVSETLQPPGATFHDWQVGQLDALYDALDARAVAR